MHDRDADEYYLPRTVIYSYTGVNARRKLERILSFVNLLSRRNRLNIYMTESTDDEIALALADENNGVIVSFSPYELEEFVVVPKNFGEVYGMVIDMLPGRRYVIDYSMSSERRSRLDNVSPFSQFREDTVEVVPLGSIPPRSLPRQLWSPFLQRRPARSSRSRSPQRRPARSSRSRSPPRSP